MNLFDSLQSNVHGIVTNTMGYDASWTDANNVVHAAKVLLNDPTDNKDKISEQEYNTSNTQMEYLQGDLPGLYEAIQRTNGGQTVNINGNAYLTLTAKRKYDGKTIIVDLQIADS